MNIAQAKQQVKDTIEAYLAVDDDGEQLLARAQQRPVFLVGAPGIGKTAIMAQIADELDLGLVSYSMTHHTRQSALGLPFITHQDYEGYEYDASEYTMSEIIDAVYENMRTTGRTQGILFLDEINCVSETLYPSMLQFLQFKTFGRHAVPEGWIVVTAGNPPEYNRSVHEFDIVTLDRVKRIAVEPDFSAWKAYAVKKGVHPAVLTFLEAKPDRFYSIKTSLDGKQFVTARGWDDLSDIIRAYEELGKTVDEALISHYVQDPKIAGEFAAYHELFNKYRDDYRIEAILEGAAPDEVVQRAKDAEFDERLSLLGLLLDALEPRFRAIMNRTDVVLAVRDDLRTVKQSVSEGEAPVGSLANIISQKQDLLDALCAGGTSSKSKRAVMRAGIAELERFQEGLAGGCGDASADMQALEEMFARASQLDAEVEAQEARIAAVFAFLMEAFGDAQEMLIFVTELTQRTPSARYIAQFGSESYFDHNQPMILSDAHRRLRSLVEDLEL